MHISARRNGLVGINCLKNLSLKSLHLSWNRVYTAERLEQLKNLESVNFLHNSMDNLQSFKFHPKLHTINLEANLIKLTSEVTALASVKFLRSLTLYGNPVTHGLSKPSVNLTHRMTYPPSFGL